MSETKYNNRDIKIQYLNRMYNKYTSHIINFESHIKKIHSEWIIDINSRNIILQKLDNMIRHMIKIYNSNLIQNYTEFDDFPNMLIDKQTERTYNTIIDGMDLLDYLSTKNISVDPFNNIKTDLVDLAKEHGICTLEEFFEIYFNTRYTHFFNKSDTELFELYNKVFVPLSIDINHVKTARNQSNNNSSQFVITKVQIDCDSLIDRTCAIIINFPEISIVLEGYIVIDALNVYIRTSQICSKYIFNIRTEVKAIIKKSYPFLDGSFFTKYSKFTNGCCYFVNSPMELVKKIAANYHLFKEISNKNFNLIMKDFVNGDIESMFQVINLLLMGSEQNVSTAVFLFNLLKEKKVNGETIYDIIYHNLSFYSQIKLKKYSNLIKTELTKIKTLTPETTSLEKRLATMVNMPDSVKSYILEKNSEIKSGENNYKLQMAINGLMQFPWKAKDFSNDFSLIKKSLSKARTYLQSVAGKLDETVFGHESSKKVLIELVGKWIQNPDSTGQVIGLVGPPGVGKTLLAKSISTALNIPLSIVGLGGMSDSADLIGHSFTYAGAQYGMIIRQMIKAGNWRSVMFFDEVDKVSKRNDTNEIYNTLIHITDPNMNQHFQDRFYSSSIEFDLSGVLIVFSYNDSSRLDPILLDRIKEIKISPYSTQEKISIAQNYVMNELCQSIGFDRNRISIDDSMVQYIIEKYTLEAGVRELRRKLEQILLKLNIDRFYLRGPFRELMRKQYIELMSGENNCSNNYSEELSDEDKKTDLNSYIEYKKSKFEDVLDSVTLDRIYNLEINDKLIITKELIYKYLDKPIMLIEKIHKNDMVGVINGLYATSIGMGGIIPIQIYKNYIGDSNGSNNSTGSSDTSSIKLKITGNQKQVMRESVICALTTAVNILSTENKNKLLKNFPHGFHIHAPDGGTPKDGPSAGCAFTTAFVSILLNKKINRNIAMTGEIELTGKISKIGGLDTKLAGAKKAGVKCIYICEENREDAEIIRKKSPELFDHTFEIQIVNHIIDIVTDPNVIIDITDADFDQNILNDSRRQK